MDEARDILDDGVPAIGSVLDGIYRIERLIGQGAMGSVLAAEDLALGRRVAVKVLHARLGRRAESVLRFRREARAIARLRSPYAVRLHAFGVLDDGTCYLAMELVDGEPLTRLLRREAPLPLRRGLALLRKVTEVLVDAHGVGVIHRDLKPDNVLVVRRGDEDDFVKVVDFGLARFGEAPAGLELTQRGMILGTPAYMAPEQIDGQTADARADLYALGAMAWELLLGRRPFERESVQAMLFAHLTEALPRPRDLRPDIPLPAAVEELLTALMARFPEQRPQSAKEVLATLDRLLAAAPAEAGPTRGPRRPDAADDGELEDSAEVPTMVISRWDQAPGWGETLAEASAARGGLPAAPGADRMVGREAERRTLAAALDALVRTHQPRIVVVSGDPGAGKSTLVSWLIDQARQRPCLRVAAGAHREGGVALRGLSEIAATLLGVPPGAQLSAAEVRARIQAAVPGAGAGEAGEDAARFFLRLLFPELAYEEGPQLGGAAQSAWVAANLRRLVYSRAGECPLALVLEDLHHADATTRSVVDELVQSLQREPAPVLLVLTTRPLPPGAAGALAPLLAAGRDDSPRAPLHLLLGPLDAAETAALAAGRGGAISEALARTVHRLTGGNPHLVRQIVGYLREAELVRASPAGLTLAGGVDVSTLLPPDLRQVQALRVEQALARQADPDTARRVLEAAAVLGPRVPLGLLERTLAGAGAALPRTALEDALDGLLAAELLALGRERGEDEVRFATELVREAVVATVAPTFRARRLHAAAARAKEERAGDGLPQVAREVAEHHRRAREHALALDRVLLAARTARLRANDREALECYEAADEVLELAGAEDGLRGEVRAELGRLHAGFAAYEDAERHLLRAEEAFERAGRRADRERARLERAAVLAARGDLGPARTLAAAIVAAAATPAERAAATSRLGEICRLQGDLEDARGHLEAALAEVPPDDHDLRARTLLHIGLNHVTRGRLSEADEALRSALAAHERCQDPQGRARCLNAMGVVAYFRGDSEEARRCYRESLAVASRLGDQAAVGRCVMNLGTIHHKEARFAQAFEAYERSLRIFRAIGNRTEEAHCEMNLGLALLEVGELVEAEEHLAPARRLYEEVGDRLGAANADAHRAAGFARAGRGEAAAKLLDRALAQVQALGAESHYATFLVLRSGVERDRGNLEEARGLARRALSLVLRERRSGDEGLVKSALGAALGASAAGRQRAATLLREARESIEAQRDRRHLVEVDLRLGEVLAALGRTDEAEELLAAALERAESTGYLNAEVVRAYERAARLARARGDDERVRRLGARRDAAAARVVAGGGHIRSEVGGTTRDA
jgi:serine/threonine-protein kinase